MLHRDSQIDIRPVLIGATLALVLASPWLWGAGFSMVARLNENTAARQLTPVIAALDRYQATQGHYPQVISELGLTGVSLPVPPLGWRYGYTLAGGGGSYYLAMQSGADDRCVFYSAGTHVWATQPTDCPPGDAGPRYERFP